MQLRSVTLWQLRLAHHTRSHTHSHTLSHLHIGRRTHNRQTDSHTDRQTDWLSSLAHSLSRRPCQSTCASTRKNKCKLFLLHGLRVFRGSIGSSSRQQAAEPAAAEAASRTQTMNAQRNEAFAEPMRWHDASESRAPTTRCGTTR